MLTQHAAARARPLAAVSLGRSSLDSLCLLISRRGLQKLAAAEWYRYKNQSFKCFSFESLQKPSRRRASLSSSSPSSRLQLCFQCRYSLSLFNAAIIRAAFCRCAQSSKSLKTLSLLKPHGLQTVHTIRFLIQDTAPVGGACLRCLIVVLVCGACFNRREVLISSDNVCLQHSYTR